jgi:hypothetical protein
VWRIARGDGTGGRHEEEGSVGGKREKGTKRASRMDVERFNCERINEKRKQQLTSFVCSITPRKQVVKNSSSHSSSRTNDQDDDEQR